MTQKPLHHPWAAMMMRIVVVVLVVVGMPHVYLLLSHHYHNESYYNHYYYYYYNYYYCCYYWYLHTRRLPGHVLVHPVIAEAMLSLASIGQSQKTRPHTLNENKGVVREMTVMKLAIPMKLP